MEFRSDSSPLRAPISPVRTGTRSAEFPRADARRATRSLRTSRVHGDFAVKNRGGELTSPIGADGTFELEGLTTGEHEAEIRYKGQRCRFTFEAKEGDGPLVDLGLLRCATP